MIRQSGPVNPGYKVNKLDGLPPSRKNSYPQLFANIRTVYRACQLPSVQKEARVSTMVRVRCSLSGMR